ncbi:hypothetical protein HPB50_002041 [Hyalomma asiaticum]|uniref:Uncharacterized protein n=1 Tax=Hyalomma asiaticum TaxID=266040 RepID=A0ACB7TDD9_HYAAI|nr:hypothetical protein HPB50_002041 [Hyalomma asiaticum]
MEVHGNEEGSSSSNGQSAPKRAVACEQDGVANRVKSELRDTLSALSQSIKQLGENFAQLQQYIRSYSEKPHVILHQETLIPNITLTGYQPVSRHSDGQGVCTLVSNQLTHLSATSNAEYVMTEILPGSSDRSSIFLLNVYSSPKDRRQRFKALQKKATNTKTNQRHLLARAVHEAKQSSSEEEVMKRLVQKYLPVDSSPATTYREYSGTANPELDAEICNEEPKGWKPIAESEIKLLTGDGIPIPRVDSIRVLGMTIASNGSNAKTILKLATKTDP